MVLFILGVSPGDTVGLNLDGGTLYIGGVDPKIMTNLPITRGFAGCISEVGFH